MRPEPFGNPDGVPAQSPLRVAVVSMHTSPADRPGKGDAGGMNVLVLESAMALAARGNQVDVFTRSAGAPHTESLAPGVTLYALETGGGIVRKHELPNLADAFGEQLERAALAASAPYDVIHAHYWLSGLAALPVSLSLGMPIVQTFHTLAEEKNRRVGEGTRAEPERRLLTERYLAGEVDAIAAVSRAEIDVLCDGVGAPAERVWLVPPAVDTLLFHPEPLPSRLEVRSRLGVRPEDGLVVCVG
ncbi:MAG TPA: glycosyltransferase, partial [Agrococcus sp.]|nr:glycosyltransferase [Agrococcus sp.]